MKHILIYIMMSLYMIPLCAQEYKDTVFLAILARNKAHMLPYYLSCIDKLEYDKRLITIYINTNNNSDETESILRDWSIKNQHIYKQIIFESHEVPDLVDTLPHDWTDQRLKVLGEIRNHSLQIAHLCASDYYFVVDCDNFITPATLQHLIMQRKPIIAPMLRAIPDPTNNYSNFFGEINEDGYFQDDDRYWSVLRRDVIGTIQVPVIHCTYLIDLTYLDKITYVDDTDDYEFIIFSRSARDNGVPQYICNELNFGTIFHCLDSLDIDQEKERIDAYFLKKDK
jgi:hypothetical protein